MTTIQMHGLKKTISHLIPNSKIHVTNNIKKEDIDNKGFKLSGILGLTGGSYDENQFNFWFETIDGSISKIEITRDNIPLTKQEMKLLGRLPDAITGLSVVPTRKGLILAQNIASYLSFEHLLISKFLRSGHASTYWVPAYVLILLQELTYARYEGTICTSGFVYTSQPNMYIQEIENVEEYEFIKFNSSISLTESHFEKPASFRYVDGRNSFYLIDNQQNILGILRNKQPKDFTIVDRSAHNHIRPLVEKMPGRVWIAYVGNNNDVNVHMSGDIHLCWYKNHWHLRDKSILSSLLEKHKCKETFVKKLCPVIYTLSDLRMGSVILIPDEINKMPHVRGKIDNSTLGEALTESVIQRSFTKMVDSNSAIGVLSSDGLTTVTKAGDVIGCGDIIDLSIKNETRVSGGGRTQAAINSSYYGLSIKVSEDGPISIYYHGDELIKL